RRALREIVICVGGAPALGLQRAAQPQIFPPGRRRALRVERVGGRRETLFGFGQTIGGDERLGGNQHRLKRVEGRRVGTEDFVGQRQRFERGSPAQRQPCAEHAH